jgi:hypothetical protein
MKPINILLVLIILCIGYYTYQEIETYKSSEDPIILELKMRLSGLISKVDIDKLGIYIDNTGSYTINKRRIFMCVKNPNNGSDYHIQTLIHVIVHELAHVYNEEIGHGDEFDQIHLDLRNRAASLGILDLNHKVPENYCEISKE